MGANVTYLGQEAGVAKKMVGNMVFHVGEPTYVSDTKLGKKLKGQIESAESRGVPPVWLIEHVGKVTKVHTKSERAAKEEAKLVMKKGYAFGQLVRKKAQKEAMMASMIDDPDISDEKISALETEVSKLKADIQEHEEGQVFDAAMRQAKAALEEETAEKNDEIDALKAELEDLKASLNTPSPDPAD